jgi:hypothetical protein
VIEIAHVVKKFGIGMVDMKEFLWSNFNIASAEAKNHGAATALFPRLSGCCGAAGG